MATYGEQPPPYAQTASQPPYAPSASQPLGWKPAEYGSAPQQPGYYPSGSGYPPQAQVPYATGYAPGYPQNVSDGTHLEGGEGATFVFSDKKIRHAFIRKVFMILTAQLLVTTAICAIFYFVKDIRVFLIHNQWMYWISYGIFLVTYICLVCCRSCARRAPMNFFALALLTLAMSYMVATITSFYDIESVMIAFGITVGLCLALTIFAWQTRIDFTMCTGLMFALVMVLFFTGMACWIWGLIAGWNRVIMVVYGGVGALVFSFFLIYDIQTVIGGRKYELSPEEYIYGAVQIYLDVVYIFLMLLSVVGGSRSSS